MPYGFSNRDFEAPEVAARAPSQFDPSDGNLHLVYAGALLPKAGGVLERALEGLAILRARGSALGRRARFHFIGTGASPNDPNGHGVLPVAAKWGLADVVTEHPHRMSYLDVLVHLRHAHGIVILGSNEPHYSPSKVYQAVQARRPVLAFLHEASTALRVLEASRAGVAIRLGDRALPEASAVADTLERFLATRHDADRIDWDAFAAYSARESARLMAGALDAAMALWAAKGRPRGPRQAI
jgi:hypothetical protein